MATHHHDLIPDFATLSNSKADGRGKITELAIRNYGE